MEVGCSQATTVSVTSVCVIDTASVTFSACAKFYCSPFKVLILEAEFG